MKWWIKERDNPQLGTYWVPMGKISQKEAREHGKALYGYNTMHSFDSLEAYEEKLRQLKKSGERIM